MVDLAHHGKEYNKKKRQMETMIIHMDNDLHLSNIDIAYYNLDDGEKQLVLEKLNTKMLDVLKEVRDDLKKELANHLDKISTTVQEIRSESEFN
jgi:hypothetical protein